VTSSWQPKIQLTHEIEHHGLVSSAFLNRALEAGLKELRSDGWATSVDSLETLGEALVRSSSDAGESGLFERNGSLLQVDLWSSHLSVSVASAERATAERIIEGLRKTFPLPDPSASHEVPITFWTNTPEARSARTRPRRSWSGEGAAPAHVLARRAVLAQLGPLVEAAACLEGSECVDRDDRAPGRRRRRARRFPGDRPTSVLLLL